MKNVNWPVFRDRLAEKMCNWVIPRTLDWNDLDGYVREWNEKVGDTCQEFSKLQVVKPRDPSLNLWFTKELDDERIRVADLGQKAVRTIDQRDWDSLHDAS